MKILLVNPPLMQPTGPYPAISYLAGFLQTIGRAAVLADASVELLNRLFSRSGIDAMVREMGPADATTDPSVARFLAMAARYASTIDTAVACLQGRDRGAVARALRPGFFPPPLDAREAWATLSYYQLQVREAELGALTSGQRARVLAFADPVRLAFGPAGDSEEARYRASQIIGDVARIIRLTLEPDFELDAYAERLSDQCATFDGLAERLKTSSGLLDRETDAIADALAHAHGPDVVGVSVPFPGSVYGALRMAARFKAVNPSVRIVMGGGWVNTQLRALRDPAIFEYVDFITLDDGERPLACVLEHLEGQRDATTLCRTFVRQDGVVTFIDHPGQPDVPWADTGTPTYVGLPLERYWSYRPSVQAFQRIWGQHWNKLTLAHGCYWKRCAFCDTHLDYISRYEPVPIDVTIDRIKRLMDETGESGFHFVDEAMPPAVMRRLAERLIAESLSIAWWGNARFDRALEDMGPLLAESGCVAITGGLETASERTLALMEKGVPLAQGAQVCHGLARAGIIVHAYLIYGFPTETAQETVDALEFVRQMFRAGALHSAMWHQFVLTAFSPMARNPERFGITLRANAPQPFSNYLLEYDEPGSIDHGAFGDGLRRAVSEFRIGIGLDRPVPSWFSGIAMPAPTLPPDFVERAISRA